MLQKDEKYQSKFINILTDVFLNSKLNPYFHMILNLLQFLVVLGILLQEESFDIKNIKFSHNSFFNTLVLLILVLQCIFMVLIGFLLIYQKNQKKDNVFILQYQGYVTKKIKQIVAIFFIIYRKILSLISLQFSLWALKDANQALQTSWIVSLINLFLMVPFYMFSGMIFASKIAFLPNVVSFGYKINLQTLIFTYLPLMIMINSFKSQLMALTNILFVILGVATLFIRPLILYRNNIVGLVGYGMILGLLTVSGCHKILDIKTQTHQDYLLFFISSLLIAWIVVKYAQTRTNSILLSKIQNTLFNKIRNWNKDQIIFYYFANYDNEKNSIILYLVQELQRLKQNKVTQKEGSQKCILQQQTGYANKELIFLVQRIIESLKSTSFKDPSLRKLLNQFLFQKYKTIYNPKNLFEQNLGKNQLKQKIAHSQNLSMILAQILLFDQINLRKCYTFMKIHENLLHKSDNLSFISKIEIHSLIQIVENDLKFKTNSQKGYNLKAQKYFIFQQQYEQLKNLIKNACDQKINFWRQNLHPDPNCHRIHQTIKQNYTIYTKIQSLTFQIAGEFPHKGPLILYDLIASYTNKILNIKTFSTVNPFFSLIKRYKQQLVNEKKQGLLSQNTTIKKFSLIQNIGVCLVDLQTQEGKILWANEYFWTEFYLQNCKNSSKTKIEKNNFVFDVMIPELRFRHKTYFRLFTESQKLNHQHDLSFVYQSDTKIIDRVSAQIQIFPSFKNGFNVSVFLFKNEVKQSDCEKSTVLVKSDMSIVGYTEQFLKQKSNLTQEKNKTVKIDSESREFLCEQLITDDIFHNFLQSHRSGDTKRKDEIPLCVQDSQYKLRVLKVYSLEENVTANIFSSQDLESLQQKQSTCQQVENCIYLLEFEKRKQEKSTDSSDEKDIFKTGSTYQQGWMGNNSDIRSHVSQFTSINSNNNIERALKKVSEGQKNQIQQNDSQKKQDQPEQIQKKYKTLMFKKGSRAACFWMVFTLVVVLILVAAILCNLFIFQNRELLYEDKKLTIKYFNELITDISQLCIALREYNYFAYVKGPNDPRIPLLISQVKNQQRQVSFKLEYLSGYMNQKWTALQILKNGKFNFVLQDQYVVIANYMLSSMTYLSQVRPQQLVFPPFYAEYFGKPLTSTQVNFNEAIFNGIFVVLTNLSNLRAQFLPLVLENITDIRDQIYIYPCAIGFFILLTFLVVSICIEKKSQNLRGNALYLLDSVPQKLIRQKIYILQQFKYNNCFVLANNLSSTAQEQNDGQVEQISYKNVTFQMKNLLKVTDKYSSSLKQGAKTNQKGSETQNQTKRDLVDMEEIYDLEAPQRESQNQKPITLSANHKLQDERNSRKKALKLPLKRMQKCRLLFYVMVIGPSFGYFLAMLLGGFNIDSYMSLSFRMGSQIHNKKTNQQLAFLLTRETFYFQKMKVLENLNWKNMVMSEISDTMMHDRMLQKLVEENEQAVNLRKLMASITYGNLCDEIDKFNGSVYYDVTFSRQECESFESGLLKQGLKQMQNKFLQTAIEIINSVPEIATFTIPQRYKYLKMPELKTMKIILAYLQQLMDIMDTTLQSDLDNQIFAHVKKTRLYSGISILVLVIILVAVRLRCAITKRHKKEIISILEILSLQSIKGHPKLNKTFSQMPLKFHN